MSKFLDSSGVAVLWAAVKNLIDTGVATDITQIQSKLTELASKDSNLQSQITNLKTTLDTLTNNPDAAINSFNEIVNFLANVENSETLEGIIAGLTSSIASGDKTEADARKAADDDIMALIVKLHADIKYGANKTVIERGVSTPITITHSATFDGKPLTYTLQVNGAAVASSYSISEKTIFNGVFKINNSDPKLVTDIAKSVTVNAYYPKFVGGTTKTTITSADILGFTKMAISGSAAGTVSVTSKANEYIWFCVPTGMTINKVTLGGFNVPIEAVVTVAVSDRGNYNCYRSSNPLSASTRSFVIS